MELCNNNQNSCRICFENEENSIFIFSDEAKKLHLQAKIRKYLYITITADDTFPKIICQRCVQTLNWIHKFATMAVKTQNKFSKLLSNIVSSKITSTNQTDSNHSLLHSYLTQDKIEKTIKEDSLDDSEVTEMEVRIDPMLILQYKEECDSNNSSNEADETSVSSNSEIIDDAEQIESKKPYECDECPRRFKTQFALQNHTWCHTSKQRKKLTANYLNNLQDEKNYLTSNQSDQEKNILTFQCQICGRNLPTGDNLKLHLELHQQKGKYGCDICGRIFKTETNLCRHKEYHEGLQHPCSVCGRVYPTNSTLRAHSITHSDVRPHKCNVCEKTFKRNQDLKFHINQHTGARPYQCPYCPKAFASSGNCFSHRKRMHPQQVERDREKTLST